MLGPAVIQVTLLAVVLRFIFFVRNGNIFAVRKDVDLAGSVLPIAAVILFAPTLAIARKQIIQAFAWLVCARAAVPKLERAIQLRLRIKIAGCSLGKLRLIHSVGDEVPI